jgi:hypothetical protein
MMKKTALLLSAMLAFTIFAFAGFLLAVRADSLARLPVNSSITALERQNNLVLVHVENIDSHQPVLRSVWVAIRFRSESQTVLTFVRLYPATDDPKAGQKLADAFGLTNTGAPAPVFFRQLNEQGIQSSGYMLVDDSGMQQVAGWIRLSAPKVNTSGDDQILQSGCAALAASSSASLAAFDWTTFAGHLNTDLAFDEILNEWDQLITTGQSLRCELATH